ncbi:7TM diverse intracellular signaling domain-containing protein [Pseudotenacibaculum haliotis]|uniref:7TM diverse intracellular signaling domain-containing protein n=1 Tax=Pseudotenacibaculum haliotis TaxID=1862138 RepID=A0ABW5LST4_9FLAO
MSALLYGQNTENLIKEISVFKDVEEQLLIKDIEKIEFTSVKDKVINLNDGVFWYKVELSDLEKGKTIVFDIRENTIKTIDIFQGGKKIADRNNDMGITNTAIKIENATGSTFYVKVRFYRQVFFPLAVSYFSAYEKNAKIRLLKNGFYYGFVIMVCIINLFFYLSLKDKTFLYYCLFVATTNIGISDYDGFSKLWVVESISDHINVFSHFLIALTGAMFATVFLNLKTFVPKSLYRGAGLLLLPLISYGIYLPTHNYVFYALGDTFCLLVLAYYWGLGVYVLKTEKFAKFFVIGYSLVLFSALLFVIPQDLGISVFSVTIGHVKFGALFEMLILTYATTYRTKILKEKNEQMGTELQSYIGQVMQLENSLQTLSDIKDEEETLQVEEKLLKVAEKNELTDRETDVLLLIAKGFNNQQIAEELFVSVNTVKYHIRNIYEKLDVKKRTEITSKLLFNV